MTEVRPFTIHVPDDRLARIKAAVAAAELPPIPVDDANWSYGLDVAWFRTFLDYWATEHDWRAQEAKLNAWPQFKAEIDGLDIHFYHVKGSASRPRPLILTHGWPGSVFEFFALIEPLAHPERFGGDPEDGFDVVIPSLPGVGFSDHPPRPIGPRAIASIWRKLMVDVLGYERFAAQGGDLGSSISTWLGSDHGDVVCAVHLNLCVPLMTGEPQSEEEAAWRKAFLGVQQRESAYMLQHMSKPQTVATALAASPVALAGWITEKFATWGDTGGDIESRFSKDQLIANLMFYLVAHGGGTSIWLYRGAAEERATGRFEGMRVDAPTAFALFPKEFLPAPPRHAAERYWNVQRWTPMKSGGHFAALEEPQALLEDVREFFRDHL
jgi:pimeloyl-ACP methyl ester carboxylesterase